MYHIAQQSGYRRMRLISPMDGAGDVERILMVSYRTEPRASSMGHGHWKRSRTQVAHEALKVSMCLWRWRSSLTSVSALTRHRCRLNIWCSSGILQSNLVFFFQGPNNIDCSRSVFIDIVHQNSLRKFLWRIFKWFKFQLAWRLGDKKALMLFCNQQNKKTRNLYTTKNMSLDSEDRCHKKNIRLARFWWTGWNLAIHAAKSNGPSSTWGFSIWNTLRAQTSFIKT